ncbi:MAG TPA: hypothetical protein VMT76_02630 [Puia sp.]|nr:hypothetical protein [Puia sp.]
MQKSATSILLFSLLFIFSCNKTNNPNSNNLNKVKLYIEDATQTAYNEIDTFTLSYDNQDRIISLESPIIKQTYTYGSGNSFSMDLYTYGAWSIHEIFYLNGSAIVDSTLQYNNTSDTSSEGYLFSGTTLLQKKEYIYSSSAVQIDTQDDYTYDNNGNMTKDVQSDGNGNVGTVITYTYTDKPLNPLVTPKYFTLQSKNLPATQTQVDGYGNPLLTITYSYNFDNQGRLIKDTETYDNGDVVVKSYVYY